ncbi:MAG TPA: GNAT family N-acetyltransferase [Gemmatimonadales bacterium]|nr:GNAT family N-acetyltransferase [Gemmatimonadales bacterium]
MTTLTRVSLRELEAADVARVVELTRNTGVFREEEIAIAEEVATEAVKAIRADGAERPYYALGAEVEGRVVGWICWGATPCTVATWDLYWMAVDPDMHGQGVGTALLEEMENRLSDKARLIVIDTSGRPDYAPTRAFYRARGYQTAAVVRDFYALGDDQVIFSKRLHRDPR